MSDRETSPLFVTTPDRQHLPPVVHSNIHTDHGVAQSRSPSPRPRARRQKGTHTTTPHLPRRWALADAYVENASATRPRVIGESVESFGELCKSTMCSKSGELSLIYPSRHHSQGARRGDRAQVQQPGRGRERHGSTSPPPPQ